jgi:hypothetical protein
MADEQISLPSLIFIVVISGLVIRYMFFSSPSPPAAGSGFRQPRDAAAASRAREAAVERIQQMFPQVDRRAVLWDLQRTRGSISATTERILSGRIETVSLFVVPQVALCFSLVPSVSRARDNTALLREPHCCNNGSGWTNLDGTTPVVAPSDVPAAAAALIARALGVAGPQQQQ